MSLNKEFSPGNERTSTSGENVGYEEVRRDRSQTQAVRRRSLGSRFPS